MQGLRALNRYFELTGRSGRAEYWQFLLITNVAGWLAGILDALLSPPYNPSHKFAGMLALATLIPSFCVGVRRFHDRNKSGWWFGALWIGLAISGAVMILGKVIEDRNGDDTYEMTGIGLFLIACLYGVFCIVQLAKKGDEYHNDYGAPDVAETPTPHSPVLRAFGPAPTPSTARDPRPSTIDDAMTAIERLGKMREQGYLSDEEFGAQKQRLLDGVNGATS